MRIVAIIQARMGSTRLPGKVLLPLAGTPVLRHVVDRVRAAGVFADVIVATTVGAIDDPIAAACTTWGVTCFRGAEANVLERYGLAAAAGDADAVMRITADCPLIDPDVLAAMVGRFVAAAPAIDLLTNARARTYPRGLDAELFSRAALDVMLAAPTTSRQREHVTPYLYDNPAQFTIVDHLHRVDAAHLRWTLDTTEDYELLRRIFDSGGDPGALRLDDVLELIAQHPDWALINAAVEQKTG